MSAPHSLYTVAMRDKRGQRVLIRVRASGPNDAAIVAGLELVSHPPYRRAEVTLVAIPGGRP